VANSLTSARDRAVQAAGGAVSRQGAQDWLLAAADQGLISLSNFVAGVYLARMLDPTQFGVYAVGFLLLHGIGAVQEGLILQPMSTLGAMLSAPRFGRHLTATGVIQVLEAILSALAVAIGGWILTRLGNDTAGPTLFGLWFVFLIWQPQEYLRRLFYPARRIRDAVLNTAVASGLRLVVLFWFGSRGELTGIAGMNAIAWGALAALPLGLWQARRYWQGPELDLRGTWRENWTFGRWLLGGQLAAWCSLEVYPILAAGLISFAAAGAYRALQTLVAPVHVCDRGARSIPHPARLARRGTPGPGCVEAGPAEGVHFPRRPGRGVSPAGDTCCARLAGDPLRRQVPGLRSGGRALCPAVRTLVLVLPFMVGLKAVQRTRPIFIAHALAIVAMFTVGIALIQALGVYGAVLGQVLNALIALTVIGLAWRRESRRAPPASAPEVVEAQTGETVAGP